MSRITPIANRRLRFRYHAMVAPFDTLVNNGLPSSAEDIINQDITTFNPDLWMASSMQTWWGGVFLHSSDLFCLIYPRMAGSLSGELGHLVSCSSADLEQTQDYEGRNGANGLLQRPERPMRRDFMLLRRLHMTWASNLTRLRDLKWCLQRSSLRSFYSPCS